MFNPAAPEIRLKRAPPMWCRCLEMAKLQGQGSRPVRPVQTGQGGCPSQAEACPTRLDGQADPEGIPLSYCAL